MVKRDRIAMIPARGGSKRLPHKNVVDFHGKPLIAWTIEAARQIRFDRIVVSTDDQQIAAIARAYGAEVPFLRDTHFDDHATASEATLTGVRQSSAHFAENYEVVVQLMPTCPLRSASDIDRALRAFQASGADFQVSCLRFGWMKPWWALQLDDRGHGRRLFPEAFLARSQDLPPLYLPSGAVWIAHAAALRASGTFYGPGHRFEPIPWIAGIDIDDEDDLGLAKAAFLIKQKPAGAS